MSKSGSFAQLTAPEIFRNLLAAGSTGRLKVISGAARRTIWFDKGRPVYAASSHPAEGFGEILVKAGKLDSAQLRQALAASPSSRKVGATLIEMKLLAPADLLWATNQQAREIILATFTLADGSFVFDEVDLSTEDIVKLNIKLDALLRDGVQRMTDPRLILRALGSLEVRIEAPATTRAQIFALNPAENGLLESIRRGPSSVRDLCRGAGMPAIDACRTLVTLMTSGAARRTPTA